MIKTYLKHQIIDKFINIVLDGFINTFNKTETLTLSINDFTEGDRYQYIYAKDEFCGVRYIQCNDCLINGIDGNMLSVVSRYSHIIIDFGSIEVLKAWESYYA